MTQPATPPAGPSVKSFRLVGTMAGAGAVAGLLIVVVFQLTQPAVLANRAARLDAAIATVLPSLEKYETLYLAGNTLSPTLPPGADPKKVEKIYRGSDAAGRPIGYAIPASEPGFQDAIDILFGYDAEKQSTLGLVILASRETPGLGDKIERPEWLQQFGDARTPIVGVKAGSSQKPEDVDMVTGATISSRTVIAAINKAVARWAPILQTYHDGGTR